LIHVWCGEKRRWVVEICGGGEGGGEKGGGGTDVYWWWSGEWDGGDRLLLEMKKMIN
ncbi:hypothetical protein Tco_0423719, partial [Tanacetum coccineum]